MTYPAVVLLGFGFSSMVVNSLSFAADLIGENKVSSMALPLGGNYEFHGLTYIIENFINFCLLD